MSWGNSRLLRLSWEHIIVALDKLRLLLIRLLHQKSASLWMKPNGCFDWHILAATTIRAHYDLLSLVLLKLLFGTLIVSKNRCSNGTPAWRRQVVLHLNGNQRLLRYKGRLIGKQNVWDADGELWRRLLESLGNCHRLSLEFIVSQQLLIPHLRLSLSLLN